MEQEMFHDKFLRAATGFALSLTMIAWTGATAIGIGSLLAVVLKVDPTTGIWVAALVAILYTMMGGSWAIVWTDVIQGGIRLVVGLIFYGVLYYVTGGFGDLHTKLVSTKPQLLSFGAAGFRESSALLLTSITGLFTFPAYWQRCFSAKNSKAAFRGYLYTSCFAFLMYSLSVYAGMVAFSRNPNLPRPDMAFPYLLNTYVHPLLAGLMVVAIIGADMTVSATLLNAGVTMWTVDIIKPYFKLDATDKQLVQIARWMTLVMGVGVVGAAFSFPTIISAGLWGYQMAGGGLFIPMMLGLYWKDANGRTKVTKNAALASLLIAGSLAAWIQFDPALLKIFGGGINPGLFLSLILTVGISVYERGRIQNNAEPEPVKEVVK
jgi:SSS family solute:Na+ symporter